MFRLAAVTFFLYESYELTLTYFIPPQIWQQYKKFMWGEKNNLSIAKTSKHTSIQAMHANITDDNTVCICVDNKIQVLVFSKVARFPLVTQFPVSHLPLLEVWRWDCWCWLLFCRFHCLISELFFEPLSEHLHCTGCYLLLHNDPSMLWF